MVVIVHQHPLLFRQHCTSDAFLRCLWIFNPIYYKYEDSQKTEHYHLKNMFVGSEHSILGLYCFWRALMHKIGFKSCKVLTLREHGALNPSLGYCLYCTLMSSSESMVCLSVVMTDEIGKNLRFVLLDGGPYRALTYCIPHTKLQRSV